MQFLVVILDLSRDSHRRRTMEVCLAQHFGACS